jgi:hypothetical protein
MIGTPIGDVDTKSGGPTSVSVGAATEARRGTGTIDDSVAVPTASGAIGRTGRHITTVAIRATALAAGFGVLRFTRRTPGRFTVVAFLGSVWATTAPLFFVV